MAFGLSGGGSGFSFEFRYAAGSEVIVELELIASFSDGDNDLPPACLKAEIALSPLRLSQLCAVIEAWLETDVSDPGLLDGVHHLAASEWNVIDLVFGKRRDIISASEKPVVTLIYKLGDLCGECKFVTNQSYMDHFARGLRELKTLIR